MILRPLALVILLCASVVAAPPSLTITADQADGVYEVGDTVVWEIAWEGETPPPSRATFEVKRGGLKVCGLGDFGPLSNQPAQVTHRFDEPGAVLIEVKATTPAGEEASAVDGVIASPELIELSAERPADFDGFWEAKLAELAAVPVNAQLAVADGGRDDLTYHELTMDNIRGTRIRGQLARPKAGEKFPAMLIVQWAGVYGLDQSWVNGPAGRGWLTLNILAHDLPIDEPAEFYAEQREGPLKGYPSIGNDDRDTSYFLRMYLSCHRAVEYLASRPDWDGRTIVVMGGSQGGMQALVTAGLNPKVTAALANVPAGCDMLGPDVGRRPGWPQWVMGSGGGKDKDRVREASRYYDVANFAPRINCPVLVGVGLADQTCPPEGILAAVNQIPAPTEVVFLPRGEHQDRAGSHKPYHDRTWGAWLPALGRGEAAPVRGWVAAPAMAE